MEDNILLKTEQLKKFQRDGLLVLQPSEWLLPGELSTVREEVERIQNLPESKDKWMVYFDELQSGVRRLNRIENFLPWSEKLAELFSDERLGKTAATLMGGPIVLFKDKINFKQPGGEGFEPHQDAQAGWDQFGHSTHLSVAVAIDQCTAANGALEFVRGRHQEGLLGPLGAQLPPEFVSNAKWELIDASPGSVILFDSFSPHRSAPNRSPNQRRLIYITYSLAREGSFREEYYSRKRQSYPPNILRDPNVVYGYKI